MSGEALSFPGVLAPVALHCPHTPGVFPDEIVLWCQPQEANTVPSVGHLFFGNEGNYVNLYNCLVDRPTYRMSTNGHTIALTLQDRRWRWRFATITGAYNIRRPNGEIINEKNPRELAQLLFVAMGESSYLLNLLPTDGRPEVYWDHASAPLELARLCDLFGCEVDIDIATNTAAIRRLNYGPSFMPLTDIKSLSLTIDPPELPQMLRLICGETVVDSLVQLEAVGLDTDGLVKPIDDLSYTPLGGWEEEGDWGQFHGVEDPDERSLAVQTVGRWFRVKWFPGETLQVPGLGGTLDSISQILPLRASLIADVTDTEFPALSPVYGAHFVEGSPSIGENLEGLPRVRVPYRIDRNSGLIVFSRPMIRISDADKWEAADLFVRTAFNIKDGQLLNRLRQEYEFPLGGPFGEIPIREGGMNRRVVAIFDTSTDPPTLATVDDNLVELSEEANNLLLAASLQYTPTAAGINIFRGTQLVGTNGVIRQVIWTISTQAGWNTVVSLASDGSPYAQKAANRRLWRQAKQAIGPDIWDRVYRLLGDTGSLG